MANKTSILVAGAGGRMGRAVVAEILKTPGAKLAGGFERPGGPDIGKDIGVLAGLDALGLAVEASAESGLAIAEAAKTIPIVKSGNMSVGVNVLMALVEAGAKALSDDYDIEIFEAHHRAKVDAPSGTALMLGAAAARGRGVDLGAKRASGERAGERKTGDIGFSVSRGGGIVGEHRVSFAGAQEVITLSHSAIDRGLFAKGAVAAARWAMGKPPGLYSMRDVLGLN